MNPKTWSLDKSRIFEGYVFATHGERCQYIGTSMRDRPQWLKKHVGRWRPIEDVRQEAAPPGPPVESEIDLGAAPGGLNGQTSPRGGRDNGGDENDVGLVDTLAGDRSPPLEPTSLPTPVTTTVENGTTKAELLRGTKVAMSEAEGPKTEITPVGAMGRKRVRSGGRQIKKQKLPAKVAKAGGMLSPERMRIVLDSLRERPILSHAATKAGIHRRTLEYWIRRSAAGDAGYDLEWEGLEWRFHEHCESATQEAHDTIIAAALEIAMGADLTDENGKPVPKAIRKQKGKILRFLLEWWRPDKWGKHRKIDVPHNGGVLVVGAISHAIPKKVNNGAAASVKARKWKAGRRMIRKTEV